MNKKVLQEGILRSLGPGILFAAASVGTSHLVQSTRAGADFGTGMALIIFIAMVIKYPAFQFAPRYFVATGNSIVEGFARQGSWALVLFCLASVGTVFIGGAALLLVSSGIIKATFNLDVPLVNIAIALIIFTITLLIIGRYHWLDLVMKGLVAVMALATIIATISIIPQINWSQTVHLFPERMDLPTIFFIAALVGWMPAPFEAAVMHSLWSQAKSRDTGHRASVHENYLDFHTGYLVTLFMALCFMLLGAGLMYQSGLSFENNAGGFANQVISLYGQTLGTWSRPFIGLLAFIVMYSTVIAHMDGFSRIFRAIISEFRHLKQGHTVQPSTSNSGYVILLIIIGAGILSVLLFFLTSFKSLIDFATTLSFIMLPVYAILIHRSMTGPEIPDELLPGIMMQRFSMLCNFLLLAFSLGYLYLLIIN